jgi:hypothetical protein
MTRDVNVLVTWLLIVVFTAAIGATSVPIIYSFLPWRKHLIGRMFMLQAVVLAAAIDMTIVFYFLKPKDVLIIFWVQALVYTGIAVSTITLAWATFRTRYPPKRRYQLLFNKGVYEFLKKLVQIGLPALATLYIGLAQLWHLPNVTAVVGTITLVTTFLGVCLGISTSTYNNTEMKYDGLVVIHPGDEGSTLQLTNVSTDALENKNEILLKVDNRVANP